MGPTAAPWRVTATAISRANASVDMPLLEEDVPHLIHRAARVEEMHGKCVKIFRMQLAKRKQDDILQAQRQKEDAKRARQQAQVYIYIHTPFFGVILRSIPQGMILDVQPLVKSLFCPIRPSPNRCFDFEASTP